MTSHPLYINTGMKGISSTQERKLLGRRQVINHESQSNIFTIRVRNIVLRTQIMPANTATLSFRPGLRHKVNYGREKLEEKYQNRNRNSNTTTTTGLCLPFPVFFLVRTRSPVECDPHCARFGWGSGPTSPGLV